MQKYSNSFANTAMPTTIARLGVTQEPFSLQLDHPFSLLDHALRLRLYHQLDPWALGNLSLNLDRIPTKADKVDKEILDSDVFGRSLLIT